MSTACRSCDLAVYSCWLNCRHVVHRDQVELPLFIFTQNPLKATPFLRHTFVPFDFSGHDIIHYSGYTVSLSTILSLSHSSGHCKSVSLFNDNMTNTKTTIMRVAEYLQSPKFSCHYLLMCTICCHFSSHLFPHRKPDNSLKSPMSLTQNL